MIESLLEKLRFDSKAGLWRAPLIHLFQRSWEVVLSMDGERGSPPRPPTVDQKKTLEIYVAHGDKLLRRAEARLLEYYRGIRPTYEKMFDRAAVAELLPSVDLVESLPLVITPKTLYISETDPRGTMCLLFDCTWDRPHGIGVRFIGQDVDLVGSQDEML
jgi:hypothetical protein